MKKSVGATVITILMLLLFTQVAVGQTEAEAPKTSEKGTLLGISGGAAGSAAGQCAFYDLRIQIPGEIVYLRLWMSASDAAWFDLHIGESITVWWKRDDEGHKILLGARANEVTSIFTGPSGIVLPGPVESVGP